MRLMGPKDAGWQQMSRIAIFVFLLLAGLLLFRYFTYYASYDQGIFNQVFWNNLHGNLFQSTLSSQLSTNVVHGGEFPDVSYRRLGQHFTPALLLWLPFYALFPNAATLCILQAAFTAIAGLLLYALARKYLTPPLAGAIALSFYGAIAVLNPVLANFHDLGQIPLFFFGLLLALEYRRWSLFALLCLAILAVREDSAIPLFGVGFYLLASRRHPRIGLGVCALSVGYFLVVTTVFMPAFSADISQRFMVEEFGQFTNNQEASTLDVLWAMVRQPGLTLRELVSPVDDTLGYLVGHWLPLAFVPAVSPTTWLMTAPSLLKLGLSEGNSGLNVSLRYALTLVPGMFYGAILWWAGQGWRRLGLPLETLPSRSPSRNFRRFWRGCLILSLLLVPLLNPSRAFYFLVPDSFQPWVYVSPFTQIVRSAQINTLISQIPPTASVTATAYIAPHVSSRRAVLRMPATEYFDDAGTQQSVDYVVADLWMPRHYQAASRRDREEFAGFTQVINTWIREGSYGLLAADNGVVLLQRGASHQPAALANWEAFLRDR